MADSRDTSKGASGDGELFAIIGLMVAWFGGTMVIDAFAEDLFGPWRILRQLELYPLTLIPNSLQAYLGLPADALYDALLAQDVAGWQSSDIQAWRTQFDSLLLPWISWIFALPVLWLGWRRMDRGSATQHVFANANELLRVQAHMYPHLEDVVEKEMHKRPLHYDRNDPDTWTDAKSIPPHVYAQMAPPPGLEDHPEAGPIWDGKDCFDDDLAERSFMEQLGPVFASIADLDAVERHVFDALLPVQVFSRSEIAADTKIVLQDLQHQRSAPAVLTPFQKAFRQEVVEALRHQRSWIQKLRDRMRGFAKGVSHVDAANLLGQNRLREFAGTPSLQEKYRAVVAERAMASRRYTRTGLMTMLENGRQGGVFPSSRLRPTVKPYSRTLWFALSSVGRRVSFAECAGLFSHWLLECQLDGRVGVLPYGDVTLAVEALKKYLGCMPPKNAKVPKTEPAEKVAQ